MGVFLQSVPFSGLFRDGVEWITQRWAGIKRSITYEVFQHTLDAARFPRIEEKVPLEAFPISGMPLKRVMDLIVVSGSGPQALFDAILDDRNVDVYALIAHGVGINSRDENGLTPLQYALMTENRELITYLINSGADIRNLDKYGLNSLHHAAIWGLTEHITFLIGKELDVNAVDHDGRTPLHYAAEWGHEADVDILLSKGGDPNQLSKDQMTPLEIAIQKGHGKIVSRLIRGGAQVPDDARVKGTIRLLTDPKLAGYSWI